MLPLISTAYFHNFLESLGNGILICNVEHEVYAANSAAAAMLGLADAQACMGRTPAELFDGLSNKPAFLAFFHEMASADLPGRSFRGTLTRQLAPSGTVELHLALGVSRLMDSGKLFGLLISLTDLSDVVLLHEREKLYLRENAELAREKHESLRHLADSVAHQLRNPLMTIGGFANLMLRKRGAEDPDQPKLTAIVESAERLEQVVAAVSDYNALVLAAPAPSPVQAALDQAVLALAKRRPDLAAAEPPLAELVRGELAPAVLPLDLGLFATALAAVIENALEARAASPVLVTGRIHKGHYELAVTDSGPGIAPTALPYVFDFFYTTKARGVGMGLPRALKIAREHAGRLTLTSAPGQGATATFSLPLAAAM